jgi:two-component system LytT family sensor kinase
MTDSGPAAARMAPQGVDCSPPPPHSAYMASRGPALSAEADPERVEGSKAPLRPRLLFMVATVLALSSTIQSWRLQTLGVDHTWALTLRLMGQLMVLNTIYWYVPALLAPTIVAITQRYRVGYTRWTRTLSVHLASAFAYSIIHTAFMLMTRAVLFPFGGRMVETVSWWSYVQRQYLTQLDWMLATYFCLVALGHAIAYWREAEKRAVSAERLQTRLAEAQLQALQRQLQPHFLFNTLHAISSLMRSDVEAADVMIDRLSDLLRMSLRSNTQEVSVKQELEILQSYLAIEQTRFRDRLSVSIDVDPGVMDARVPHLLLQPLVENAVRHGIAPRARPGRIDVRVFRNGGQLQLEVQDSGDGVPPDKLSALNDGVGLSNTRARLGHLYGPDHRFAFENLAGGGFQVSIGIPFHAAPARVEAVRAEEVA